MVHTVLNQISYRSLKKRGICLDHARPQVLPGHPADGILPLWLRIHIVHNYLTYQRHGPGFLLVKGLHIILQLRCQIQVIDQILHPLSLAADHLCLSVFFLVQIFTVFQLSGIAKHHGKRRADVMRYSCDPVGSGRLLLLQLPVFLFKDLGCPVDAFCNICQHPLLLQAYLLSFR